jgi:hypothetical protein
MQYRATNHNPSTRIFNTVRPITTPRRESDLGEHAPAVDGRLPQCNALRLRRLHRLVPLVETQNPLNFSAPPSRPCNASPPAASSPLPRCGSPAGGRSVPKPVPFLGPFHTTRQRVCTGPRLQVRWRGATGGVPTQPRRHSRHVHRRCGGRRGRRGSGGGGRAEEGRGGKRKGG